LKLQPVAVQGDIIRQLRLGKIDSVTSLDRLAVIMK